MTTAPKMELLGGIDPEALCEAYGTPLDAYNAETILEQLKTFHAAFAALPHRILYAAKALSPVEILRLFKEEGTGLDAVSIQELELGLRAKFQPGDSLVTLEKFSARHGRVPCCLRLKPSSGESESSETSARWYEESKFGISTGEIERAAKLVADRNLRVEGLHVHSSSVILDADVFIEAAEDALRGRRRIPLA